MKKIVFLLLDGLADLPINNTGEIKKVFSNVKALPKRKLKGISIIFIHRKEDVNKLSLYNLFYLHNLYNKTFYRL